ncbi:Arginine metabolism regulation protein I [Cucumispora dikerogammari]|nr:Arginine metabolism regulation protein I [Cucumispora dikerogammari]
MPLKKKKLSKPNTNIIINEKVASSESSYESFKSISSQTKRHSSCEDTEDKLLNSTDSSHKKTTRYITDKHRRMSSYLKRMKGIMKKSYELAVLTNSQLLFMSVCKSKKTIHTFSTHKFKSLIADFKEIIEGYLVRDDEVFHSEQIEFFCGKTDEFVKNSDSFCEEKDDEKNVNSDSSHNEQTKDLSL